ncbi:MAG: hypothetical protein R3D58_07000 [Saprospiraceae bacterium]|nr:hypothetical protein [Lewinellaceae bacterium]
MTRLFKQRWFLVAVAVAITAGFIFYVLPKLKKGKTGQGNMLQGAPVQEAPKQTLSSRLVGNVVVSGN